MRFGQPSFAILCFPPHFPAIRIPRDSHSFNCIAWKSVGYYWCLSLLEQVDRHSHCSRLVCTERLDPHLSRLSPMLCSLLLSPVAFLCDKQGITFGPAGCLSFSVNLCTHLGDRKTLLLWVVERDAAGISKSPATQTLPTAISVSLQHLCLGS